MFEKEAEEYRKDLKSKFFLSEPQLDLTCQGFKDGAKFGYNQAMQDKQKWHNLQKNSDNLPPMLDNEKKISHSVWIHIKNWGTDRGYYDYSRNVWIVGGYYDSNRHH